MRLRSLSPPSSHTRVGSHLPSGDRLCFHSSSSEQNTAAPDAHARNPLDVSDSLHISPGRSEAHVG